MIHINKMMNRKLSKKKKKVKLNLNRRGIPQTLQNGASEIDPLFIGGRCYYNQLVVQNANPLLCKLQSN